MKPISRDFAEDKVASEVSGACRCSISPATRGLSPKPGKLVSPDMTAIADIIFDLGNVLAPFDWNRAIERLLTRLPLRVVDMVRCDLQSFKQLFLKRSEELETGRLPFERFWQYACDELGTSLSLEEFRVIWCDIFEANESMIDLGHRLSAEYGVWLASNTCREHFEWIIHRFPKIRFFRRAALSYELGAMKPARQYYIKALELFDISPRSSVFIDDIRENVEAARDVGMHGIVFDGYEQLVEALAKVGVMIPT